MKKIRIRLFFKNCGCQVLEWFSRMTETWTYFSVDLTENKSPAFQEQPEPPPQTPDYYSHTSHTIQQMMLASPPFLVQKTLPIDITPCHRAGFSVSSSISFPTSLSLQVITSYHHGKDSLEGPNTMNLHNSVRATYWNFGALYGWICFWQFSHISPSSISPRDGMQAEAQSERRA